MAVALGSTSGELEWQPWWPWIESPTKADMKLAWKWFVLVLATRVPELVR